MLFLFLAGAAGAAAAVSTYWGIKNVISSTFPAIAAAGPAENGTNLGTGNSLTNPTGSTTGSLVIHFLAMDKAGGAVELTGVSTGWTNIDGGSNFEVGLVPIMRILDGSGDDTLTVDTDGNEDYSSYPIMFAPGTHGVSNVGTDIPFAIGTNAGLVPQPASLNAGTGNWKYIVAVAQDFTIGDSFSGVPSGWTEIVNQKSTNSTTSIGLGISYKDSAATTESPGTYGTLMTEWVTVTMAIPSV
jgi:hypothetical protein